MKYYLKTILIFFCFSVLCSCGKEGPVGALGPQGLPGEVGPAGADGSVILSGRTAPASGVGNVGDYYIDITTGDFYGPKQASGWTAPFNLRGAKGDKGNKGDDGANGAKGDKGDKGDTGASGAKGDKGDTGATGSKGEKGDKGDTGASGARGADGQNGSRIYSGNGAPADTLGTAGDYYLDKQNFALYGPKVLDSAWGAGLVLQGKDGNANVKSWIARNVKIATFFGVNVPALTDEIFNNGAVMVYGYPSLGRSSGTVWNFFPFTFNWETVQGQYASGEVTVQSFQEGFIRFAIEPAYDASGMYGDNAIIDIRIVLIQGNFGGDIILKTSPDFDFLKAKYKLRD